MLYYKQRRELREIIRLQKLILEEDNHAVIREIKAQIHLCEALTWKDYKLSRKY